MVSVSLVRGRASKALSWAHRPLGRVKFQAALKRSEGPLRIEIGAWTHRRPGWISTDVHWRGSTFLDAAREWPLPPGTVDYIYADNVIEHMTLESSRSFLHYAHLALRPGGRIRLVTPDIGRLVSIYSGGPDAARPLVHQLLAEGYAMNHQVDVLRFAFHDDGHHLGYLWDRNSLETELRAAGFNHIQEHVAGYSDDPNLRDLESRVGSPVAQICIILESTRA